MIKIRLTRGVVFHGKKNVAYRRGTVFTVNPETTDAFELELLRLAKPGEKHLGRQVAEQILEGPTYQFTPVELDILRLAPRNAIPTIAQGLAQKLGCSVDHVMRIMSNALEEPLEFAGDPLELLLPPELPPEVSTVSFRFAQHEIENLKLTPLSMRPSIIEPVAERAQCSLQEAQLLLLDQVGGEWPMELPPVDLMEEAPDEVRSEPESKPRKGSK